MSKRKDKYIEFLENKMAISSQSGFEVADGDLTPTLYPHVRDTVKWAIRGGRRAIFSSFGMQKTVTQLEIERVIISREGGKGLIVCPKRVVVEFVEQARKWLDMDVRYVRTMEEVRACPTDIMITNYERVRDGEEGVRIDPNYFTVTSLDEASVLRGYGTKTFQEFMPLFSGVKYRFVATATPSPNRLKELIHYSGYLGVMDTGQALTRFFKRDSTKANNLTLYPNKEQEFWLWVATWELFLTKPSDLGYPDDGYELPELRVHEEVVSVDHTTAGADRDGQMKMFRDAALGLNAAAKERRDNMPEKIARVVEIINRPENCDDHFLLWHDLEDERHALCKAIPGCKAVYGSQDEDEADRNVLDFKNDFKKRKKHEILRTGRCADYWGRHHDEPRPNYFSYCVPEHLVEKVEPLVPEYAGLIGVSEYGHLVWHKAPPKLHAGKISDEQLNLVEKFYYNWKEQVRRNAEHDEIVREFRREIDFLKTEFKAETGRDVYDY